MKRIRSFVVAAVALAGLTLLAAPSAHAGSVGVSVNIGGGGYYYGRPAYCYPGSYYSSRPVYPAYRYPAYYRPAPVYYRPPVYRYSPGYSSRSVHYYRR